MESNNDIEKRGSLIFGPKEIGRLEFFIRLLVFTGLLLLSLLIPKVMEPIAKFTEQTVNESNSTFYLIMLIITSSASLLIFLALFIISFIGTIFAILARLRNMNMSLWYIILFFIPIVFIFFTLFILIFKGFEPNTD